VAPSRAGVLLALSYIGFISLGLPDGVLGAAWPAMRAELGLALEGGGKVLLLATTGTVLSSLLSGRLLARVDTGSVLTGSGLLAGTALLMYGLAPSWTWVLAAALVAGFGGGAVDAALNGYVGRHHSVRHMNWLHGCWGIGATLGPLTVASVLRVVPGSEAWRTAYLSLAALELALVLAFLSTRRLWRQAEAVVEPRSGQPLHTSGAGRGNARLTADMWANVLFFFLYSAVEAGAGLWIASFLIASKGASLPAAGALVSLYWGMLTAGRFLLGAMAERIGPARLLSLCCATALGALLLLCLPPAPLAVAAGAIGLLGLALAPIYPLLMHDTPRRFEAAVARRLVGYQIAAASTAIAIIPWAIGYLARRSSVLVIPPALAALATVLVALERRRRGAAS
jgi:fucose permease